jgi:carboxylate-amine ligase
LTIEFNSSPEPTLGVEEEYQLCDPYTGDLVPVADRIMDAASEELRGRLSYDLLRTLVEVNTEVTATVDEAVEDLLKRRRQVMATAEAVGCTLGITGTHPFADPKEQRFVSTPDYRWVAEQLGYVAQRNLTFGLHVHVGVDDGDRAVYVANRLRKWLGALIAIAANSPFLDNVDTGWDSSRLYAFGAFPRAGIPPRLRTYDEFAKHIDGLIAVGSITKARQIWWNVRAHPQYGTVEMRVFDVMVSLPRTAAMIALTQALVVAYSEAHRNGVPEPELCEEYLEDLRWKGMRFGLDCKVIDPEICEVCTMKEFIERLMAVARPAATALGTEHYLDVVDEIVATGNGATLQRAMRDRLGGDLKVLQHELLREAKDIGIENPELPST